MFVEYQIKGLTSKEKVNSFNLPVYLPTPHQLQALIKINPNFNLERMEQLVRPREFLLHPDFPHQIIMHYRAVMEGLFGDHFGTEIIDHLFHLSEKKFKESFVFLDLSYKQVIESFVLLKRKPYDP